MKVNKDKCKVLHLGKKSPWQQERLGTGEACSGSSSAEKELGDSKLSRNQSATKKVNSTLGCVPF